MLSNKCEFHGSSEMTIINGFPLVTASVAPWRTQLLNGHECWAQVQICNPSTTMVTSPYKWKILEWDEKHNTNKNYWGETLSAHKTGKIAKHSKTNFKRYWGSLHDGNRRCYICPACKNNDYTSVFPFANRLSLINLFEKRNVIFR